MYVQIVLCLVGSSYLIVVPIETKLFFFLHFCKNIPLGTGSQVNEKKRI